MKEIYRYYNRTNTCDICGNKLVPGIARREYDKDGNQTGRWICRNCRQKEYRKNPNSFHSLLKEMTDFRLCKLDPNSNHGKGLIFQQITVKARRVKDLNIEYDNFHAPIDHSRDPELGILQSKGAVYSIKEKNWHCNWSNEHNKEFDNLIFYCMDKDMKNVERVYIFPKKEVLKITTITIVKNPTKRRFVEQWYEKFRVDEKPYNDVYHKIDLKWLKTKNVSA